MRVEDTAAQELDFARGTLREARPESYQSSAQPVCSGWRAHTLSDEPLVPLISESYSMHDL